MNPQNHWEQIYQSKTADAVSWFRPHLEHSLSLIEKAAPNRAMSIIDVGGGQSTLVDDLLGADYCDISVLDISQSAIDATRRRLGPAGAAVTWSVADITQAELPAARYDADGLHSEFGDAFSLIESATELHQTPIALLPFSGPLTVRFQEGSIWQ